jgi:hypothetical protein
MGRAETDASSPSAEALSFSAPASSPAPEIATWRLNLPANPRAARERLAQAEAQVQAAETGLALIPQRLEQLAQQGRPAPAAGISFGTGAAEGMSLAQPEAGLLHLLAEFQEGAGPQFSFAAAAGPGNWSKAEEEFQATLKRLLGLLTHLAWVETQVENQLLGRTIVGWTGNMRTAWGAGFGPDYLALHQRALTLALASRQTLLRTLVIAVQGAAKIAALLTIPGGQILALPIAWKYVSQVLAEVNKYRELKTG